MPNTFSFLTYLCTFNYHGTAKSHSIMKKTTAFSSILFLGGFGSLSYLAAQLRDLDLSFSLRGEDSSFYC
jgi:hypothetical protein